MFNPLEQFELFVIYDLSFFFFYMFDFSITNFVVILFIISFIFYYIIFFFFYSIRSRRRTIVPTYWLAFYELIYLFVLNIVLEQTNNKGMKYFPFLFTLFFFILFSNLLGLLPFSFTITSHVVMTFSLSISIILGFTYIGFKNYKWNFIKFFIPSDAPNFLKPLLFLIEILSYFIRIFSLAIRLSANMMAGHTLLFIVSNSIFKLKKISIILFFIPWLFILALIVLEIGIALLQAYVFLILCSIYLNDVLTNPEEH